MTLKPSLRCLMYLLFTFFTFFTTKMFSQNLLDTSFWTIGTGDVTDFQMYGGTISNIRELGNNHIGEEVVLWKAIPNPSSNSDGGIYSWDKNINNLNTYRFAVWIKKTNSNSGSTYFGCASNNGSQGPQTYRLNGTLDSNPYFWYGDLPKLNHWYLLIGYVHASNYTGVSIGKIYDGVTGESVLNTYRDYKFSSSATVLMLRTFLYGQSNQNDRQYFYEPRIEQVNGFEQSIDQLLNLHPDSFLFFSYDVAGNQTQRFYCPESTGSTTCIIPTAPSKQSQEDVKDDLVEIDNEENDILNHSKEVSVFPNPTDGKVQIQIKSELLTKIEYIKIYNTNSALIQNVKFTDSQSKLDIDLSGKPTGLYFVHIHFNDGSESVTKKIIKK